MTVQKQLRMLWVLSLLLILVNAGLVGWIWLRPAPPHPPKPGGDHVMTERLGLDESQQEKLKSLRETHFERMKSLHEETRVAKDALFELIKVPQPDSSALEAALKTSGQLEIVRDRSTFMHFRDIRAILNAEQQAKFDDLLKEIIHPAPPAGRGMRPGPGGPPPPH